ncbi:methyl-accepting chemotaxis protein [Alsobacter sp. R-9]
MALTSVPLGLMVWLFIAQARKEIAFSAAEVAGMAAVEPLWKAHWAAGAPVPVPASLATAGRDLTAKASGNEEQFKAGTATRAFGQALVAPQDGVDLLSLGKTAIQKVSDGSNLTLDPDVDSYYLMDVTTVRLPELVAAAAELRQSAAIYFQPGARPSSSDFVTFIRAVGRFEAAADPVQSSLASSIGGNADGSAQKALESKAALVKKLSAALLKAALDVSEQVQKGQPTAQLKAPFDKADSDLHAFAGTLWTGAAGELNRLLDTRIDGLQSNAVRQLTIAGGILLIAVLLAFFMARRIRGEIGDVVDALQRFRKGDYRFEVAHTEKPNETGEIARALKRFQDLGAQQALTMAALDGSSTMLMITDPDEKVVFMSGSLLNLFMQLEPTFRAARHDFSVEKMFGEHIDYYNQNANLRRELIIDDGKVRKVRLMVDGKTILVDMSYIYAPDGARLGHTLLWHDTTAELEAQIEIAQVVSAAAEGDFSKRLDMSGKTGFVRDISEGLNKVSGTVQAAVEDFAAVMGAVASGDLTRRATNTYRGVLGELQASIDDTIDRLSETVTTIQTTAVDVGTAATEISSGADDLAKRTEEQASSLVETASTAELLSASVKASAQASRDAVGLADGATRVAETGGSIVTQAVEAMTRIEQASQKITDITSVIDDIAFQTNLLALNAAVEAARAGEAGKGFAVVASEVRTLAQRSSEAAKDITGLINTSTAEVAQGVKLVRSAGQVLGEIVEASKKVSTTVTRIADAANEQASGIGEMSTAVAHMDEMTQQNAALAEESAASASSLSNQIRRLNDLVAAFRTQGGHPVAPARHDAGPATPEPERLRRLAQAAFGGSGSPSRGEPKPARTVDPKPVRRQAAGGGRSTGGWEEF